MQNRNQSPELFHNSYLKQIKMASVGGLLLLAGISVASADVSTLNFDQGNGTESYDQFTGVSGNGWASPWGTLINSAGGASTSSSAVESSSPLFTGGGNYLQAAFDTVGGLSNTPAMAHYRELDTGSIDLSTSVSYNFFYRTDSSIDDAGYQIFSRVGSPGVGTSSSDTWEIFSDSDSWRLRSGGSQIDTGVTINAGEVYEFSIVSDPTSQTWSVTIAGSGTNTYTSPMPLDYRNTSTTVEGEFLNFIIQDKNAANADTLNFSVDNISVSSIPEAGSTGVLMGLVALVLIFLRRER